MSNNRFVLVQALTRFPCRENVVPETIKHYRYGMSYVVNNPNTYDSVEKKKVRKLAKLGGRKRCWTHAGLRTAPKHFQAILPKHIE